jgi:hypothetical protein
MTYLSNPKVSHRLLTFLLWLASHLNVYLYMMSVAVLIIKVRL